MSLLHTAGESLKGMGLSVFGSWLVVVCVGGLLTLGVLSALHLGILLSLGAIGLLLLIGGCCVLHRVITSSPKLEKEEPDTMADLPRHRSTPTPSVRHKREVTSLFEAETDDEATDRVSSRPIRLKNK